MRMLALLRKELADVRQNLALFVPALIVGFVADLAAGHRGDDHSVRHRRATVGLERL